MSVIILQKDERSERIETNHKGEERAKNIKLRKLGRFNDFIGK